MTSPFSIPLRHLLAANLFAGKEETRFYLKGVFVRVRKNTLQLCATDGHRAIIIDSRPAEFLPALGVTIPSALLKNLKPVKNFLDAGISLSGESVTVSYAGKDYTSKEDMGTFPDIDRVFPSFNDAWAENLMNGIGFNADYLAVYAKLHKTLGLKNPQIKISMQDARCPALIEPLTSIPPYYKSVLMPCRL